MSGSPARRHAPTRPKPAPRHAAARPEHSRVLPFTIASVVALSAAFTIATPDLPRSGAMLTASSSAFTTLPQVTDRATASAPTPGGPKGGATLTTSTLRRVPGRSCDVTVRNVLTATRAATTLRLRIGNPFGTTPLHLDAVRVERLAGDGTAVPVTDSNHRATFGGEQSLDVAAGATVWSDSVSLPVAARDRVAVSIDACWHPDARGGRHLERAIASDLFAG